MDNEKTANTAKKKINLKKIIIPSVAGLFALIIAFNSFTIVGAGHTGVVVTLGKVNEGVLQEGIHGKIPFVQDVVMIDNRIQKLEVNTEAFSKDLQARTMRTCWSFPRSTRCSRRSPRHIPPSRA